MRNVKAVPSREQQGREVAVMSEHRTAVTKKGRGFGLFPFAYIVGTLLGTVFPLLSTSEQALVQLFFKNYLDGFVTLENAGQLLSRHLGINLIPLVLLIISGYSVLGIPVLLLSCSCKGVLNGAVYTCVLTNMCPMAPKEFILRYLLFELGGTAALFALLWELYPICTGLFFAYFRKNVLACASVKRIERLLTIFACYLGWCLLAHTISQTLLAAV